MRRSLIKPYRVIVEDPGSDNLLNVALIAAETEQAAETIAQRFSPDCPIRICVSTMSVNHPALKGEACGG